MCNCNRTSPETSRLLTTQPRERSRSLFSIGAVLILAVFAWSVYSHRTATAVHAGSSSASAWFGPTISNPATPPGPAPHGMVWIAGGEFSMGAADPPDMNGVGMNATKDSRPVHRVYVDGFFMDKTDVTNAQFARFVRATGYITVGERKPRAEDFPGAPPENLVAGVGGVLAA